MKSSHIKIEELRPGMVFVDAANPQERLVILKVILSDMKVWVVKIGNWVPYINYNLNFHASPITGHRKIRQTGYYLDPTVPGNIPSYLKPPPFPAPTQDTSAQTED